MSDVSFGSDGSGTLTLAGDSNPLKKELDAALSALEKFVDSTAKSLDAFDAQIASSFGKFAGTAQKAFDEFRTNAAETLKSFGTSSRGLVDELKPVEAAARDAFGAGGGKKPPTVATGNDGGDDGKPKTVDVSFASQAFNSAAISTMKSFGKSALDAFVTFGDSMDKMSQRTGFGVETLSALSHAAGQCGTTLETVEGAIRAATTVLGQAANGSTDAAKKFDRIGLSVGDLVAMKPEEQFRAIMRGVASIENPTLRASAALEIFGDAGSQLGPMINGGADALDAYLQEAKDAGVVMSGEQAASAAALSDAIGRLKTSFKGLSLAAAETLVPAARKGVDFLATLANGVRNVSERFPRLTAALETFGAAFAVCVGGAYVCERLRGYVATFAAIAKQVALTTRAVVAFSVANAGTALQVAALTGGVAALALAVGSYVMSASEELSSREENLFDDRINKNIINKTNNQAEALKEEDDDKESVLTIREKVDFSDPKVAALRSEIVKTIWEPTIHRDLVDMIAGAVVLRVGGLDWDDARTMMREALDERATFDATKGTRFQRGERRLWRSLTPRVKRLYENAGWRWEKTRAVDEPKPPAATAKIVLAASNVRTRRPTSNANESIDEIVAASEGFDVADAAAPLDQFARRVARKFGLTAVDATARAIGIRTALRKLATLESEKASANL